MPSFIVSLAAAAGLTLLSGVSAAPSASSPETLAKRDTISACKIRIDTATTTGIGYLPNSDDLSLVSSTEATKFTLKADGQLKGLVSVSNPLSRYLLMHGVLYLSF